MSTNANRFLLIMILITAPAVSGCRIGSGWKFSQWRLWPSKHSTMPDKSEGLIANFDRSSVNVADQTAESGSRFALAAYSEVDRDTARPERQGLSPVDTNRLLDSNNLQSGAKQGSDAEQRPDVKDQLDRKQSVELTEPSSAAAKIQEAQQPLLVPPTTASDGVPESGSGLDLSALEALALAYNPSLAERQAIVDSLRGRWLQAGLRPNPTLGFSGQQLFSQGQAEQIGVLAGQRIVRSEKLAADQQIACREIDVALQELAAQQRRVMTDVRLRYYDVLIAQRRLQVVAELVQIADASLKKTNSLLEAELGTKIDVLRSTVELQEAQILLETAQNQLTAAWRQLATIAGQPDLQQQLVVGSIDPDADLDEAEMRNELLQISPEIASMVAQRERAYALLHRATVEPLPDIDIQSVVQHDNGINGTDANLQVVLPIPFRNRNQGAIAEARLQLAAAEYAQQKTELSLQERLAIVWQRYESSLAQVKGYSKSAGILDNSFATLELIRKAYAAGEIGSLDLITAQRIYSQTSLQYLTALSEYWSAKIELEGQLLLGSLQN